MPQAMKGRSLISVSDLASEEIHALLRTADKLKIEQRTGIAHKCLEGKTLAMIFEKPSTRTRVSFEVGVSQLGGHALYLSSSDMQLKRGETIGDTAKVLSRYVNGIMARVFAHQTVAELAAHSTVPVINGLSDDEHPCQILGDLFTVQEKFGRLKGLKLAYFGDGNNVAHSLLLGAALVGMHIHTAHPEGYFPNEAFVEKAKALALMNGGSVTVGSDPNDAARDAEVLYTDVWVSMGQDDQGGKKNHFLPYRIDGKLLSQSRKNAVVLHCLPAHRGEEITNEVLDGPQSAVFDQAENRLHIQKAILASLM
ncbi:MAG: ornithine carbamoyltransferase [Candidatus Eremiobacteraeota bacterium]|nr:ornithine carbamoyltransferase [Candidatus Eremiobacteraeota bacterium]